MAGQCLRHIMPFCQCVHYGMMGRAIPRPSDSSAESIRRKSETRANCPQDYAGETSRAGRLEYPHTSKNRGRADKHPRDDGHKATESNGVPVGWLAGEVSRPRGQAGPPFKLAGESIPANRKITGNVHALSTRPIRKP